MKKNAFEEIIPIYDGKPEDFVWVGFGSGSGTNLRECAKKVSLPSLIVCNRPKAELLDLEILNDVHKIILDSYKSCGSYLKAKDDEATLIQYHKRSKEFDELIVESLRQWEDIIEKPIDLIVLGGYMKFVGEPLLEAYRDRIINVHPSPLHILDKNYQRVYVGDNAVKDVIKDKLIYTASSVIIVDEGIDHGEILVEGPELEVPYSLREKKVTDFEKECKKFQSKQKIISDWPALTTALQYIRDGRFGIGVRKDFCREWRTIYLDGKPLPYEGLKLK
ncbi:MAG: formyltransferase family protein [Candidatus Woesearchaeota archaeon]